jgi:hypothetical protein
MKKDLMCSNSDKDYIVDRLSAVEDVMRSSANYENAQGNVEETIKELCTRYPQCSFHIQQRFGELCRIYGLDWF